MKQQKPPEINQKMVGSKIKPLGINEIKGSSHALKFHNYRKMNELPSAPKREKD
jgi:hypothetical protein